jgi:thiamine biosynthesis lipoprotein
MGGRLRIHVTVPVASATGGSGRAQDADASGDAARLGRATASRIAAWAARLTRFDPASDLSRLNADPATPARVRPTLAAVLEWGEDAGERTGGMVDVTLLAQRLAAEHSPRAAAAASEACALEAGRSGRDDRSWSIRRAGRGAVVTRNPRVRFDLDGVAKGWLADRALGRLTAAAGAIVDADGDIAVRVAPGDRVDVGVDDPRARGRLLACLRLDGHGRGDDVYGVATSGISVHRWPQADGRPAHHLIDPRTGAPAVTDVVQATVLMRSARVAEALAKTAVMLGAAGGLAFLEAAGALAAIVLTDRGECLATPRTLSFVEAA